MNKDTILLSFTGVLVVCALIITGLLVRKEFFPPSPSLSISAYADWQAVAAEGNIQGSPDAPVKIVEFYRTLSRGDLQNILLTCHCL